MENVNKWSDTKPVIYTGQNFRSWELSIRNVLTTRRATFLLSERIPGDDELDGVALLMLQLSVAESKRHLIRSASTFRDAFNIIKGQHEAYCRANKIPFQDALLSRRQKPSECIADFLNAMDKLRSDYEDAGGTMHEEDFISLICQRLSSTYGQITVMHETSPYPDLPSLQGALLKRENAIGAAKMPASGAHAEGGWGQGRGRGGNRGRGRGRGRNGGRRPLVCFTCGCEGHPAALCPDRKQPTGTYREGRPRPAGGPGPTANCAVAMCEPKVLELQFAPEPYPVTISHVTQAPVSSQPTVEELLYDTGSNLHITSRHDLLHNFVPVPKGWPQSVAWGSKQAADPVRGVGTLLLNVGGRHIRIENVSLVKGARRTLLCSKMLHRQTDTHPRIDERGIQEGLYDANNELVIPLDAVSDLLFIRGSAVPAIGQANHASGVLWHERLAHPGFAQIKALQKRGLVPTLIGTPQRLGECAGCALGKMTCTQRELAPSERKPPAVGEVLHADLAFPSIEGKNGAKCVLTTLDEASRLVRMYPLPTKGQAADQILQLVVDRDRAGKPVRRIHWDRGGEFTSHHLVSTLRAKGILLEYSPAGQPKCNTKVERVHATVFPHLRAVIHHRQIPLDLWPMLLQGVVYVHNRMPCKGISGRIPYEVWTGHPLESLRHLRVIGCNCFYREPHPGGKLEARSHPAILVGYVSDGRGRTAVYQVWDAAKNRIIEAADVVFDERSEPSLKEPPKEFKGKPIAFAPEPTEVGDGAVSLAPAPDQSTTAPFAAPLPIAPTNSDTVLVPTEKSSEESVPDTVAPIYGVQIIPYQVTPPQGEDKDSEDRQFETASELSDAEMPLGPRKSTRARQPPQRFGFSPEAQAAEACEAAADELCMEDVQAIALYLGSAGEGVMVNLQDLNTRASLPVKYGECLHAADEGLWAPRDLTEALSRPDAERWSEAMKEEISGMIAQQVFELMDLPRGARRVGSMWVYSYKLNEDGSIARYKARLVAKGYSQKPGVDYTEVWAPTGKHSTFRALITFSAVHDYELYLADVTKAFTNGDLEGEEIYLQQPPGFDDKSGRVWRLRKALYGLKQAARAWHRKLKEAMRDIGYKPSTADPALFVNDGSGQRRFIFTHVDDLLSSAPGQEGRQDLRKILKLYPGKELGEAKNVLGMLLERDRYARTITLGQPQLVTQILERFGMECASHRASPLSGAPLTKDTNLPSLSVEEIQMYSAIVGSIMYLACVTRPDLAFAASQLSRYVVSPTHEQLVEAKRSLRYLAGTRAYKLTLGVRRKVFGAVGEEPMKACIYSDADFANCPDTSRSVTGYVMLLGGSPIAWASRRQPVVTKSTMAAEYVAALNGYR